MFGSKKEIYCGKEDDVFRKKTERLRENGIRFDIDRQIPHVSDLARGAGVGRYGETGPGTVRILVKKNDYTEAMKALREE